jgi:hypothetical protein
MREHTYYRTYIGTPHGTTSVFFGGTRFFQHVLTKLSSLENRDKLMSTTATGAMHYIGAYNSISAGGAE